MTVLYVAPGGALGSAARYFMGASVARFTPPASPLARSASTSSAVFFLGVLASLAERRFVMHPSGRAFLLIGVLAGLTTFSSYTCATFELLQEGAVLPAATIAVGQMLPPRCALVEVCVDARGNPEGRSVDSRGIDQTALRAAEGCFRPGGDRNSTWFPAVYRLSRAGRTARTVVQQQAYRRRADAPRDVLLENP